MCSQQFAVLYWMNNSGISKIYFPLSFLFKNYSLLEVLYLLIRSNNLSSSCETQIIPIEMVKINKTHTHTHTKLFEKDNSRRGISMKISDTLTLFFFWNPVLNHLPSSFLKNFKNSTLPTIFKTNFGLLSRGQPYSPDVKYCIFTFLTQRLPAAL